jgi:hypothetical protein
MLVEVAGSALYFQSVSRTGRIVDSGIILRRGVTNEGVHELATALQ